MSIQSQVDAAPRIHDPVPPPAWRVVLGGLLMGLANLVPGISGGTMILALGLYDRFIGTLADLSRLRLRVPSLVFMGLLGIGVASAFLFASKGVVYLVTHHRWAMYSLFIGLTLGGAPELWRLAGRMRPAVLVSIAVGFGGMWLFAQSGQSAIQENWLTLGLIGMAAAASMILPGISGAYVLLIFGVYETVIGSLSATSLREDLGASLAVLVPVGVGAVLGIGLLSNALKWLLRVASGPTHGVLLGLLFGSVLGLWPFQRPVHPDLAHPVKRKAVEAVVLRGESFSEARERTGVEWDDAEFARSAEPYRGRTKADIKQLSGQLERTEVETTQGAMALGLLVVGFGATALLARGGRKKD